jgi:hypothetical protein
LAHPEDLISQADAQEVVDSLLKGAQQDQEGAAGSPDSGADDVALAGLAPGSAPPSAPQATSPVPPPGPVALSPTG